MTIGELVYVWQELSVFVLAIMKRRTCGSRVLSMFSCWTQLTRRRSIHVLEAPRSTSSASSALNPRVASPATAIPCIHAPGTGI